MSNLNFNLNIPGGGIKKKEHLIGIDLFRCGCAILVFLFHTTINLNCYYGILDGFIRMGAVAMTGFFMLSGYSLFYSYNQKDLFNLQNIKIFYIKRASSILPNYYVVAILYILFLGKESLLQNFLIAPVEILGIQSVYSSLFAVSHNGGTWFISCILLCYLVFPFLCVIIKQMQVKARLIVMIILFAILLHAPFIVYVFGVQDIYSNPFFRMLEFTIGIIIASGIDSLRKCDKYKKMFSGGCTLFFELLILILGISIAYSLGIGGGYMLYSSWAALPMFCLLMVNLTMMEFKRIKNSKGLSKVIKYMSECSYAFFLAQFFTWSIVKQFSDNNIVKIVLSFLVCMVITILIYEIIEKPSKKILMERLLRKRNQEEKEMYV